MTHTHLLSLSVALLTGCAATSTTATEAPPVRGGTTAHIRATAEPGVQGNPSEDLDQIAAVLAGRWVGEAFGGIGEETWNPRIGDSLIGWFRRVVDGTIGFSEHMTVAIEEGRVTLRLKHFSPGLVGWEEIDDSVSFPFVGVDGTTVWFGGLTYHRSGDTLLAYVAMEEAGEVKEEVLRFERRPLCSERVYGAAASMRRARRGGPRRWRPWAWRLVRFG